jgi:hypothetical protein
LKGLVTIGLQASIQSRNTLALTLFMEETLKASLHFPNWKKGVDIGGYDVQCSFVLLGIAGFQVST